MQGSILLNFLFILLHSTSTLRSPRRRYHDDKFDAEDNFYKDFDNPKDVWGAEKNKGRIYDHDDKQFNDDTDDTYADIEHDSKNLRLPLEVVPYRYFLQITPILEKNTSLGERWTAPGNIRIRVKGAKAEPRITLNALRLNISTVQVIKKINGARTPVLVKSHKRSEVRADQYIIELGESIGVGNKYELKIDFIAPISTTKGEGLYRSQYLHPVSKNITYLASTQLEFFSAREVFPCFDEPGIKATFDISIGRSSRFHSLSNMNLLSTTAMEGRPGWFIDRYNRSVKMPTYLVAFVVSDFSFYEAEKSLLPKRTVRVYGPKHLIDLGAGEFSANVSAKVLSFFENHFELPYPINKMDSVAIPGFLYGAMENYGLNIYRDYILMSSTKSATQSQRSRTASVIAHESAHQYFGNIVTCKWWDSVWLNEGFATYYSYVGQNHTNPEFETMKQFLIEGTQYAFALDSRERTSYPLLLTAESMSEFNQQVTGIPYYKGASLIRMMEGFLGAETFHKGVKKYLHTWAHDVVEQDNLFHILTDQGHEDGTLPFNMTIKQIMEPWTKQRGFPVVKVISSDDDTLYILYEVNKSPSLLKRRRHTFWTIPISYATEDEPDFQNYTPKLWIPEGTVVTTMKHNTSKWIVINPETNGYYRVIYDKRLTGLLLNQFNKDHNTISPMTRSQILDDYFALGWQKDIPISMALDFTKYLSNETEDICWGAVLKYLKRLFHFYNEVQENGQIMASPRFKGFRDYMLPRIEGVLDHIGVEHVPGELGSKVIFRTRLLNYASYMGSKKALTYAGKLFEAWKNDSSNKPIPDLRDFMYCNGVAAGGMSNFLVSLERSVEETNLKEVLLLMQSLGCIKNETILMRLLESSLGGQNATVDLDKQYINVLYESIIENPLGRSVMMTFIKHRMPDMKVSFGKKFNSMMYKTFMKLASTLHTEEELMKLQTTLEENSKHFDDEIYVAIASYFSDVADNIHWMEKYYEPMRLWFESETFQ